MAKPKLLIVKVAALGWDLVPEKSTFAFRKAESIAAAVTCPVQASFKTALSPDKHGLCSNGLFFRDLRKVLFWEQSSALVEGERIWKKWRDHGRTAGMMFWQQSLGEDLDLVYSPAPIHKHSGGMIQDCHSVPRSLNDWLEEKVGRPFNLMNYWGPLASHKSSDWIVDATAAVMGMEGAPELLFSYLPHLDYDLQRYGPGSPQAGEAMRVLMQYLVQLRNAAEQHGYDFLFLGDYAIEPVSGGAVFPNRALKEAGLFSTRSIRGMEYADFFNSRAFAVVDHQLAHVYTSEPEGVAALLRELPGVESVIPRGSADHSRAGELLLVAEPGRWFAYPWWHERGQAPDYATHVDIHNKPGYDPCELFFGWPPPCVSMDTQRIRGTHGRPCDVAWVSSLDLKADTQLGLAAAVKGWLDANA